jgi:hypothetical protein
MKERYPDLPGWEFEFEEVSAGVYEVGGYDTAGHRVFAKGFDFDLLVERCRDEARRIVERGPSPRK